MLTPEAKSILQAMVFKRINEMGQTEPGTVGQDEVDILHKIYVDIVNSQR